MQLHFGPFAIDDATIELRRDGRPVRLQPQPVKVLALLAANAGRLVTRDEIRAQIWNDDTFVDFEQGLNYCIAQIRAALGDDAKEPRYVETLQRRGYRFVAPVERRGASDRTGKTIIAVLPFENLSGDPDQEFFSDGLTDEMITQLGRLNPERLGVIARTSAMKYKAARKTVAEIARELGVSFIVEGSVRRGAGRLRITATLVQVSDQTPVWVQSYERNLDDVLALQGELATALAAEIHVTLVPKEARRLASVGSVNAAAHESYLRGRYFWNKRTEEGMQKGIEHFREAIGREPNYAAAYDGIADSYTMLACRGVLPVKETFARAREAAQQALMIDPGLGEAVASLAHVRLHDWDWDGLDEEFQRALELSPGHAIARYWYAEYLMAVGRSDDAIVMVSAAQRMDPLSSVLNASKGMILYLARLHDDAVDCLREALAIDPDHFLLHFRLGLALIAHRSGQAAIDEMEAAARLSGRSTETVSGLAQAYAAVGRIDSMKEAIAELEAQQGKRYVSPYNMSRVYAAAAQSTEALTWLERAYVEHNPDLIELASDPVFDPIRSEKRFSDLAASVGGRWWTRRSATL